MNGRMSKILRRWATARKLNYRRAKRTWRQAPVPDRAEILAGIKDDIAINTPK